MLNTKMSVGRECRWAGAFGGAALLILGVMSGATAQTSSNASNYTSGAQLSVNGRTGALSLSSVLFRIPGVVSGMDASLALTFRSDQAQSDVENQISYFGLPYGWSLGLSFLYNDGETIRFNVDGQQSYILDANWDSSFTPVGSTDALTVATGLRQYNQLDANLKAVSNVAPINGADVGYVFSTLSGDAQYFSTNGLLLRHEDRFGNHIDYYYSEMAAGSPRDVTLTGIVDSWGNKIEIALCTAADKCLFSDLTEYVVTLPDGRTVRWVQDDAYAISYLVDTQGKLTKIDWTESPAEHGKYLISAMTTPSGGMTSVVWDRLPVCTEKAETTSCAVDGNTTTWPVVAALYRCPNNASGEACPAGSTDDFLTTTYAYQTQEGAYNYTGYPVHSPYAPADPNADALMASNDTAYSYTTVTSTQNYGGQTVNSVESSYNFLHLMTERSVFVRAVEASGLASMQLSKATSYCHVLSGADDSAACPMNEANYQFLPANYQSPVRVGSCQYNVGPNADSSTGRRSLVTLAYDAFGQKVNERKYHGTAATGVGSCDDRKVRLDPSGLALVTDFYFAFDTPDAPQSDGYLKLGPGSGQFGLPTAQQSFIYIDPDENGAAVHGSLAATETPIMVKLICNELESDGTNVQSSTTGLMATSASPPSSPAAKLTACAASKPWVATVAPPKVKTLSYDSQGRGTGATHAWSSDYAAPAGVAATAHTTRYNKTTVASGEAACGAASASTVLEITSTRLADPSDPSNTIGNVAQRHRLCTLNGFHLSSTVPYDPASSATPPTSYFTHYEDGLAKSVLHPNGTSVSTAYYYACPTFPDSNQSACPSTSTALSDCPAPGGTGKNCVVSTVHQGSGNTSYMDGVESVIVKDGLGRVVGHSDNTGAAAAGQGYTQPQARASSTYDSLGLVKKSSAEVGTESPLVYTTATTYGPKLRPIQHCGPRGTAHQFTYDDVQQQFKKILNGGDRESYTLNDSRKVTLLVSCALTEGTWTQAPSGSSCPIVASNTETVTCSGEGYHSYTLHDGSGLPYSVQASAGTVSNDLASLQSVTGQSTITEGETTVSAYSADGVRYGYSFSSVASADGSAVDAGTGFDRNLLGHKRRQQLSVTANSATTRVASDLFAYNALADQTSETNRMSTSDLTLQKTMSYTPSGKMQTFESYAGVTFHNYYDDMQRLVRHCYPGDQSGSQGETITRDPVTGQPTKMARFTNPNACSEDTSGDVEGIWQSYSYNRFGAMVSMDYSDGVSLGWAYDAYQRPSCFADVMATQAGHNCPASPTAANYSPTASTLLTFHQYYPDSNSFSRGLLQRSCRGVPDGNGGAVMKCLEFEYYTPETSGGMCRDGAIETDGTCTSGAANVKGAFAGQIQTESYYTGGPSDGGGTLVYQTKHLYDAHARPASVVTKNASGEIILATTFAYDQYDNLTKETSHSELDMTNTSNFQTTYGYDGLLRVISAHSEDLEGNLIRSITYEYDARSNLTKKVEVTPDVSD